MCMCGCLCVYVCRWRSLYDFVIELDCYVMYRLVGCFFFYFMRSVVDQSFSNLVVSFQVERTLVDELVLRCNSTRVSVKLNARGVAPRVVCWCGSMGFCVSGFFCYLLFVVCCCFCC
jgi:hypothetical protein